jgi:hypothetical protein
LKIINLKIVMRFITLSILMLALAGAANAEVPNEIGSADDAAEKDWQSIVSTLRPPAGPLRTHGTPPPKQNWDTVARRAREYQIKHSGSQQAKEARKLEIIAELNQRAAKGDIPVDVRAKLDAFLADPETSARDRVDVIILERDTRDIRPGLKRDEVNARRLANIRELAAEFPAEPKVWQRLLTVAKSLPGQQSQDVAREIAGAAEAPDEVKKQARSLIIQRELAGRPLEGIDLSSATGKPALIYFWTVTKPEFSELLRHYAQVPGIAFIGVNVDADGLGLKAREFARQVTLPGKQYYDGEAGPVAFRLKIGSVPAIYLIDGKGILKDTQGHVDTLSKLRRLASLERLDGSERREK